MARALWSGAISFGLVNVPVKLFKATSSSSGRGVSFNQLHADCGNRIEMHRYCPHCAREIRWDEINKGYEVDKGRYAVFRDEDFRELPRDDEAAIAIEDFTPAAEVDPIWLDRAYYVAPEGSPRAYGLLRYALEETGKVAIARMRLRTRGHLALIRPARSRLVLHTMFYADEVASAGEVPGLPDGPSLPPREIELARQLIESMSAPFEPSRFRDTWSDQLRELIARKIEGQEIAASAGATPPAAPVVDILEALRRSLDARPTAAGRAEAAAEEGAGRAVAPTKTRVAAEPKSAAASSKVRATERRRSGRPRKAG